MKRIQNMLMLACLTLVVAVIGCERRESSPSDELKIAVSIAPQAWLVDQITGGQARVLALVKAGESPTTYQPTDEQISALMHSDILFRIGVPFEHGQWYHAIEKSRHLKIVDQRQNITLRAMTRHDHHGETHHHHDDEHHHASHDPHIWLSPALLKIQGKTIADALSELRPTEAETYQANLHQLNEQLDQLDATIRNHLASLPNKTFFVFHPAWGYFADAYDLEQVAIEIEGKQPTDHELTQLQAMARERGIKVIFVQPQIAGQAAAAVAKTVGAELKVLDPLADDIIANLRAVSQALAQSQ